MRRGSIAVTLFWLSGAWLIAALVATAFLLTDLYSRALDTSLVETLEFHVQTLIGERLNRPTGDLPDGVLSDPRFARPASGDHCL